MVREISEKNLKYFLELNISLFVNFSIFYQTINRYNKDPVCYIAVKQNIQSLDF